MVGIGNVTDHDLLATTEGWGIGYGCNQGRIAPFEFTFSNLLTENGKLKWYLGKGKFTNDEIPPEFFGCAGVAEVEALQDVLLYILRSGHRHHVNITPGVYIDPIKEALEYYLKHDVAVPQYG